ncbi:hypothetical protein [Exiguobacterium aurantiacum]|uniref:Secreted protein n=2 Tax=Exiguobacterium aurantiacum TaxID=33987 RepID=A0A377HHH2_9BACL|nr:hypothetical protein [Exiguobacterium aurantiacum]STO53164.1 Uncharacterised protein [Exiguobacterium aurantiacum]
MKDHGHHHMKNLTENEVSVEAKYEFGKISIELKDQHQQAPELEVSHEKEFHLILVNEDLTEYRHLHPFKKGEGRFEQPVQLEAGAYKLFVDIQPKGLAYQVKPVHLQIDHQSSSSIESSLKVDERLTKTIEGHTVELSIDSLKAHVPTVFSYDTKESNPEPYLGALGHVVILDEAGEQFIHVHPSSHDTTEFETVFHKPGLYKVWAEFQFHGTVHTYPFVIRVSD